MAADDGVETILTDLIDQNRELRINLLPPVNTVVGDWVIFTRPNPYRLALIVCPSLPGNRIYVSLFRSPHAPPGATNNDSLPVVIHSAAFPLAISGVWYVTSDAVQAVNVVEIERIY